jgi:hypothetical protein
VETCEILQSREFPQPRVRDRDGGLRRLRGESAAPTRGYLEKVGAHASGFRVLTLDPGKDLILPRFVRDCPQITVKTSDTSVRLLRTATGEEIVSLSAGTKARRCVAALAPDGKRLVAAFGKADGSKGSELCVWDVSRWVGAPSAAELKALWADLADTNPASANRAMRVLAAYPDAAVRFFAEHLTPAPAANEIPQLIADLGAQEFKKREAAMRALARHGHAAKPALEKAATQGNEESRRRLAKLLELLRLPYTPEELRAIRAADVLEQIDNREAVRLLEMLARGEPTAASTRMALASLGRLTPGR